MSGAQGPWFSQPYSPREFAGVLWRNLVGPGQPDGRIPGATTPVVVEAIAPCRRLAFLGDLLPFAGPPPEVGDSLRAFVGEADLVVVNLEGVLVEGPTRRVFAAQAHSDGVLRLLQQIGPPERLVIVVANNHAADFGAEAFARSCDRLEGEGMTVVGRIETPTVHSGEISLTAATRWLNRSFDGVARLGGVVAPEGAQLRLLLAHWGWELEAGPRPAQLREAYDLLEQWDLVVGWHPHVPQTPTLLESRGRPRLVAWSLGNFTSPWLVGHHRRGMALRMEVGPRSSGEGWGVGRVEWIGTRIGRDRITAASHSIPR